MRFAIGGTNYVTMGTGAFKPWTSTSMNLGTTTDRWAAVNAIAGNYTGDINIGTSKGITLTDGNESTKVLTGNGTRYVGNASPSITALTATALTINGNITVSGTVDTVDIAAFKTAYDAHIHTLTVPTHGEFETGGNLGETGHYHTLEFEVTTSTDDSHSHTVVLRHTVDGNIETEPTDHHHGVSDEGTEWDISTPA